MDEAVDGWMRRGMDEIMGWDGMGKGVEWRGTE